jgi:hypothetical protein
VAAGYAGPPGLDRTTHLLITPDNSHVNDSFTDFPLTSYPSYRMVHLGCLYFLKLTGLSYFKAHSTS